ncbi:uncharacterized protein [Periplaneta americana]|uniref:uncharacterized protein isoform X2 n=1 Tax=Periplaneta americana TaxID=6978 RepID=UPI0037E781B9
MKIIVSLQAAIALCYAYDYGELLRYSLLFYEAQRSGKLPSDQKVTWRKDSALNDKGQNGEDLTEGYYDAGDFVKFGFPMAYTVTVLAWGIISHESGYKKANALSDGRQAVKWGTDYFLKCHVSSNVLYAQVGRGEIDHKYWGRPEDMKMDRPAYKIDTSHPGSDLAAETAAALAAASLVFNNTDSSYANTLLTHAKQLFNFADQYRGKYSDSIPNGYPSYNYEDELVWGATWLYKATGDQSYLTKAEQLYNEFGLQYWWGGFGWDQKNSGVDVLLAELTGKQSYKDNVQGYCDYMLNVQQKTLKGLVFIAEWGSLRSAANMVYICLQAAKLGINTDQYRQFAQKQTGYMLGDAGRSFVVGFGNNPPTHSHHRSSSCPDAPATCDWGTFSSSAPNAHVLYGALVGGPDANDNYSDVRDDAVHNEVACDYNAAYQSVLAALNELRAYDYGQVIRDSLLFYEAQRSGKLPSDQKVTWRKDSALNDKGQNGEDLTGGYYDAGDFVKFGFPMAYTATVLAWGIIGNEAGYTKANALTDARKAVKWATDYFLKCHVSENVFYGQVGEGEADHKYWGRPEDMTMDRPAYKIDTSHPGSDLAAETAAALAAASIVFWTSNSSYANTLLAHAKQLFNFADTYRGNYSDSITDGFYKSSNYQDELVWGATWLYKATGDSSYLTKAEQLYKEFGLQNWNGGFGWDQKNSGVDVLLAQVTGKQSYKDVVRGFCNWMVNSQTKTPKGLLFLSEWGSLRSAANVVYICLQVAKLGINTEQYQEFAKKQIGYMLGDTGRSFVVGYGTNPPSHEHHRSSSCPSAPATCDWNTYWSTDPNAHVLYGALVGGPDANDNYVDNRDDPVHNEVTCDYNACFQSALAALNQL